ncbi:MAG: DUF5688 family protein [Ruminococcus flavefaciens]|nr:DUF5688 family protein [Ruminococcus flavefaciens]
MNIKEFCYYVEGHIRDFLPEEIRESAIISVHAKRKTNDAICYGLTIRHGNEKVSPLLYLEDAWQRHENGEEMETVLRNLAEIYMEQPAAVPVDLSFEYESVKDRVIFQIVNKEANRANLRERIYTDIGQGLVKVYAIHQKLDGAMVEGDIPITHEVMRDYGFDMQDILRDAEENTPQIYAPLFTSMEQALAGKREDEFANGHPDECGFCVLSNTTGYRGAGVLFYSGMQKKIAEHFGKNYYVMPSSLHEVLVLPEGAGMTAEGLEQMVRAVNAEAVSREDFLSDKVMFYDREKEQLRLALPEMPDLQIGEKKGMER